MIKPSLTLVACAGLLALATPPDIGPKPIARGTTPLPPGTDLAGVPIAMQAERVDLRIVEAGTMPPDHVRDLLHVEAVFEMRNDGPTTTLETGFPAASGRMLDFEVEADGAPVAFDLVRRPSEDGAGEPWYVWQAEYPGHAVSRHVVRYSVEIRRARGFARSGYVLHTGAAWKGPIGEAIVTLRCDDGLTLDHLSSIEPQLGGTRENDRIVWRFTDLEPTEEHDIRLVWRTTPVTAMLDSARERAPMGVGQKIFLARELCDVPALFFRERMTGGELDELLSVLDALAAGETRDGDLVVAEGLRVAFVTELAEMAARAIDFAEDDGRALEVGARCLAVARACLDGRLFAGAQRVAIDGPRAERQREEIEQAIAALADRVEPADARER